MINEIPDELKNIIVERFRGGKEKQFVFLSSIKEEIVKMNRDEIPVTSQIGIIEDKYRVELQRGTYRSWVRNNKPKLQKQKEEKIVLDEDEAYEKMIMAIAQNAAFLTLAIEENVTSGKETHLWKELEDKVDSCYRGVNHYMVFYEKRGMEEKAMDLGVLNDKIYDLVSAKEEAGDCLERYVHTLIHNRGFLKGWIRGRSVSEVTEFAYKPLSEVEEELNLFTRFFVDN